MAATKFIFFTFDHQTAVISRASSWSPCFFFVLLVSLKKELDSKLIFVHVCSSNLQRNHKENRKKAQWLSIFFLKLRKSLLNSNKRNVMQKFQSCRFNGMAKIKMIYTHTHKNIHTYKDSAEFRLYLKRKFRGDKKKTTTNAVNENGYIKKYSF